jgi:dienelactone hydrolase
VGRATAARVRRGGVVAALLLFGALAPSAAALPVQVRDYDLGRVTLPDPSPKGPLPLRLWGAIGAPTTPGPHPVVLVLHGRHGDNCPTGRLDAETWPCFRRERRNDLGLRHVVRALADRGIVALAPDMNGAFTAGWGEPNDRRRWPLLVNRVLAAVAREARVGGGRFGIALRGRVDLGRLGLLGHSLSGHRAVRAALRRERNDSPAKIARGLGPVRALFLLAPVFARAPLPDRPTAIVLGSCDGDTGTMGRNYFERARRQRGRQSRVFLARLEGADHNLYNRTLARLGLEDSDCPRRRRLRAGAQQRWLARAAADFFAATLRGEPRPAWLRPRGRLPNRVYGLKVRTRRTA